MPPKRTKRDAYAELLLRTQHVTGLNKDEPDRTADEIKLLNAVYSLQKQMYHLTQLQLAAITDMILLSYELGTVSGFAEARENEPAQPEDSKTDTYGWEFGDEHF